MIPEDKKTRAEQTPDDDRIYDLLVDGELDDQRRRTLLGSLDDKPGGWRRCALAFLEAQSWGQEFRSLSARLGGKSTEVQSEDLTPKSVTAKPYRRKKDRIGQFLTIAASVLIAMGITSLMMNSGGVPGVGIMPSGSDTASIMAPSLSNAIKTPSLSGIGSQIGSLGLKDETDKALHVFSLTAKGTDGKMHISGLPAVSRDQLNEQWVKEMPTAIPDGVVESFQNAGHDVKTTRQLIPFRMKDGRKLIIPVDQVDVRYATTPYYQ